MKLFLDTNILLDFILERQSFYSEAAMIMTFAEEERIKVCASAVSFITASYICVERCKMPITVFRQKFDFIRNIVEICSVTSDDILHSYNSNWKDFEDGVQYSSAKRAGSDAIVTRNVQDFEENEIPILSLEETCIKLKTASRSVGHLL